MKLHRICTKLPIYSTGCIILIFASSSTWAELDFQRQELRNEKLLEADIRQTRNSLNAPASSSVPRNQEIEVILAPNERTILYNQNSTPLLSSQVALPVTKINFRMGEAFKKGDVLMEIDDTIFRVNLVKAQATYERAQALLLSREKLFGDHISSYLDLKEAQATMATAQAELVLAQQQLIQTKIIAPYDGRVVQLLIQVYELPQPGQALIEIVNDKNLIAKLLVPSIYLNYIKIGKYMRVHVKETDTDVYARIIRVGAVIDPASGTIAVDAEIDNHDGHLLPGMIGTTTVDSIVDEPPRESHIGPENTERTRPEETQSQEKEHATKNESEKEIRTLNMESNLKNEPQPEETKKSLYFFKHVYDILFNPLNTTEDEAKENSEKESLEKSSTAHEHVEVKSNEQKEPTENVEAKSSQLEESVPLNTQSEQTKNVQQNDHENAEAKSIPSQESEENLEGKTSIPPEPSESIEVKGNFEPEQMEKSQLPAYHEHIENKGSIETQLLQEPINESVEESHSHQGGPLEETSSVNEAMNEQPEEHMNHQVNVNEEPTLNDVAAAQSYVIYNEEDAAPCEPQEKVGFFQYLYENFFNKFYFTTFGSSKEEQATSMENDVSERQAPIENPIEMNSDDPGEQPNN